MYRVLLDRTAFFPEGGGQPADEGTLDSSYLNTLLKMLGITYVGQFSAGICKDAGYSSIAGQIELFARLAVLAVSMPVLLALLETVHDFL